MGLTDCFDETNFKEPEITFIYTVNEVVLRIINDWSPITILRSISYLSGLSFIKNYTSYLYGPCTNAGNVYILIDWLNLHDLKFVCFTYTNQFKTHSWFDSEPSFALDTQSYSGLTVNSELQVLVSLDHPLHTKIQLIRRENSSRFGNLIETKFNVHFLSLISIFKLHSYLPELFKDYIDQLRTSFTFGSSIRFRTSILFGTSIQTRNYHL